MATSCVWEFQRPHLSWQLSESVRSWLVGLKRCVTVVRFGFAFPCWIMLPASFYILTGHLYIFGGISIWIPATSEFRVFWFVFYCSGVWVCFHTYTTHCSVVHFYMSEFPVTLWPNVDRAQVRPKPSSWARCAAWQMSGLDTRAFAAIRCFPPRPF